MATRATAASATIHGLREALVTSTRDGELRVKPVGARPRKARVAVAGYRPRVGDRVLVAPSETDDTLYVLGQLFGADEAGEHDEAPRAVRTPSGASAVAEGDTLVVRDARGRIAVQFDAATGKATISAPEGDLELAAPSGRVKITAAQDLALEAGRDVTHTAGRRVVLGVGEGETAARVSLERGTATIAAPEAKLEAKRIEARAHEAAVVAERITTVVTEVAQRVGRWELRARQLVEKVETATRDIEGLALTRAGRSRTLVRDAMDLLAKRTRVVSKEDTVVDGKRVLLG